MDDCSALWVGGHKSAVLYICCITDGKVDDMDPTNPGMTRAGGSAMGIHRQQRISKDQ